MWCSQILDKAMNEPDVDSKAATCMHNPSYICGKKKYHWASSFCANEYIPESACFKLIKARK